MVDSLCDLERSHGPGSEWSDLGRELAEVTGAPIELSVIPESLALHPTPPWPFLLHVVTDGTPGEAHLAVLCGSQQGPRRETR